ncbi:BsuPI-related putative proteinase inhibitor [Paenibacillus macerans]|uniref:BsuPI-related putative proteinase inhibitor n=1 Tax=Paenibacillus macerans TaxID=44252 RepID=UPI003D321691
MNLKNSKYITWIIMVLITGCMHNTYPDTINRSDNSTKVNNTTTLPVEKGRASMTKKFKTFSTTIKKNDYLLINFGLQNVSGMNLSIAQGSQKYEKIITNKNNEEVYKYSNNKVFTQKRIEFEVEKNAKMMFTEKWIFKGQPKDVYNINIKMIIQKVNELEDWSSDELSCSSTVKL